MRKRDRDDEDHSTGPNQGKKTKRSRTKESEPSKKSSTSNESSKGKSPAKTSKSGKSMTAKELVEEPVFEMASDDIEHTFDDVANEADQPPDDSTQTKDKDLKKNWLSRRLTVATEYFFNNDLEFLKLLDPEKKYTTSIIKTKAARYEMVGIEDMKILSLVSVKVERLHGYCHLDEIVVKRADRQLYKFKEGDFIDLHLNNIEDMLILAVQHKLFHLNGSDIVDLIVALRMFTRSLIIKRRVEDLQLSVESYQKKLNITEPQKTFLGIKFKELYTLSYKPPGVIYKDLNKQKRVMRADELYKFSDGTLKTVRDELHHRILDFRLGYNKEIFRRKWTAIDKMRLELMVKLIDKQMRERRIIRNLERLVGAQKLEMDCKLMTRTE
ncbi:hypothetical protein Tco_0554432 [Tanacetum coccineum]